MGYNSDVAYVIMGEKEAMLAALAEIRLEHPNIQKAISGDEDGDGAVIITDSTLNTGEAYRSGGDTKTMPVITLALHLRGVKWYESYEWVQNHSALWAFFEERALDLDMDVEGKFILIGEDDDDNEQKHFGGEKTDFELYDVFRFERSISIHDNGVFDAKRDIRAEVQSA
jgi:hypothetical protein